MSNYRMANKKQQTLMESFGLPDVISTNGNSRGFYHNEGGCTTQYRDGTRIWCHMGYIHRVTGPAIERENGNTEWFLWGEKVSLANFSWSIYLEETR